jgi:hypothetical protein
MLHPESVVDAITELQQARLLDSRAKDWLKCSRAFNKGTSQGTKNRTPSQVQRLEHSPLPTEMRPQFLTPS